MITPEQEAELAANYHTGRVNWLMHEGHREFWHLVDWDDATDQAVLSAQALDKLEQIIETAQAVRNYYRRR